MPIQINDLNLMNVERVLIRTALTRHGSIIAAADALGITRHGLKRKLIKHRLRWNHDRGVVEEAP